MKASLKEMYSEQVNLAWNHWIRNKKSFCVISKTKAVKESFVRWIAKNDSVIYIGPKTYLNSIKKSIPSACMIAHEDFTKKDVYLGLVSKIQRDDVLILENVARYTKITAQRFTYLHRLRKMVSRVFLVDIVPFAEDITKLYLPFSYMDRQILRYAHGYAFEHNYMELQEDGTLVRSHSLQNLAKKIHPHTLITYDRFFPKKVSIIDALMTTSEHDEYKIVKGDLFEKYSNPHRIVTYLCDWVNMRESRYDKLAELVSGEKKVVVYTNIKQNSIALLSAMRKRDIDRTSLDVRTYRSHIPKPIDSDLVVLFEMPIVNRYLAHDVLIDIQPKTTCYVFRSDAKSDKYIYGEVSKELNLINRFTITLRKIQDESLSKNIRG